MNGVDGIKVHSRPKLNSRDPQLVEFIDTNTDPLCRLSPIQKFPVNVIKFYIRWLCHHLPHHFDRPLRDETR